MISVIIPFYNERKNLEILIPTLFESLNDLKKEFEVILVDDGSDDGGVRDLLKDIKNLKIVYHKKRLGKGQALKDGLLEARGEVIVFMDADLQDDPKEIKKFLKKIDEGYDFVNGKRIKRKDNFLVKLYSSLANFFLKKLLRSPYTDINCGFKAFKKEVLEDFVFYGNNFRFFPLAVFYNGYRVTEVEVFNHPRRYGQSKFGWLKILGGLWDTFTAYFLYKFSEKPLHFFGLVGGLFFFIGLIILLTLFIERMFFGMLLYRRPILFLGILLLIIGIQILMTGILGELIVYTNIKKRKV